MSGCDGRGHARPPPRRLARPHLPGAPARGWLRAALARPCGRGLRRHEPGRRVGSRLRPRSRAGHVAASTGPERWERPVQLSTALAHRGRASPATLSSTTSSSATSVSVGDRSDCTHQRRSRPRYRISSSVSDAATRRRQKVVEHAPILAARRSWPWLHIERLEVGEDLRGRLAPEAGGSCRCRGHRRRRGRGCGRSDRRRRRRSTCAADRARVRRPARAVHRSRR